MTFWEFLSPISRKKYLFTLLFFLILGLILGIYYSLPSTTKSTIYFSVKPVSSQTKEIVSNPIEASEKLAEAISGWAKDPKFQNNILENSKTYISNFKSKISAKKQNRVNVFFTIKLNGNERNYSEKITEETVKVLNDRINNFNQNTIFPLQITTPQITNLPYEIPFWWIFIGGIIISFGLAGVFIYFLESGRGVIIFPEQIKELLSESPILFVNSKIGKHDEKLLEQFILSFDSPRLIGTFPKAEKYFSLAPSDTINNEIDMPVLIVQIGKTKIREIKNLIAIFGEELAVIIFEK